MALKDYKVTDNIPTLACNAKGKVFKLNALPDKIGKQLVLGEDTYPTETGMVRYIWID